MAPGFPFPIRAFPTTNLPLRSTLIPTHSIRPRFTFPSSIPSRQASRYRPYRPQPPPRYNRFHKAQRLYQLWNISPEFRYGIAAVGAGCGIFYYVNLERVPISGRLRFNCISPALEDRIAGRKDQQVLEAYGNRVLPPDHPYSKMVTRVLKRLIPVSGAEDVKWEVNVIDDPEENAFVMPGGKVFVFSGILDVCNGEDGLAAVLGHEIAHQFAHHIAEQISQSFYLVPLAIGIAYCFDISGQSSQSLLDLILEKPGSRKMESEADYIGLLMMAQACYDPDAAVRFWQRMAEEESAPPQFLSTHPASKNRITQIQEWLPEAYDKRAKSECGSTIGWSDQFKQVLGSREDEFWF